MVRGQRTEIRQAAAAETTIRVSQQQVLEAQLLELGDDDLLQRIDNELNENSALEEGADPENDALDASDAGSFEQQEEPDFDMPLPYDVETDELPVYQPSNGEENRPEIPIGDTKSFVEDLTSQIAEHDMEDGKQEELVRYLIGSLDDNGFIDRPLANISDDLLFNHNIDASPEELSRALSVLQSFDPPGIGARDLRECMLLQLQRKIDSLPVAGNLNRLSVLSIAKDLVENHAALLRQNNRKRMEEELHVDAETLQEVLDALARLNPHPGLSLSEGAADRSQTVVPDFIIETSLDGDISFTMRTSRLPRLRVNPAYQLMVEQTDTKNMSASQKEDFKYLKGNVENAYMFIQALKKRQDTLYRTMRAIIDLQRDFMLTQDEMTLRPLTGGEVARIVGVDGSTVSRAISSRYALLDGTLYPLKKFFLRTRRNAEGEDVLRTQVETALQEVIDHEDKANPLSDQAISDLLVSRGLNIRRRTVAKYREQMNIPTASLRRQF